ncbi:MAG: hypothetical protein ACFFDT_34120 [Candidatus Hodarchaeota archaeon]
MVEDFFERTEKEREISQEWLDRQRGRLGRTLNQISRFQQSSLSAKQILTIAISISFLINLISSIIVSMLNQPTNQAAQYVFFGSLISLVIVAYVSWKVIQSYRPPKPFLYLPITLDDIRPFLTSTQNSLNQIMEFLKTRQLTEGKFKDFAQALFSQLQKWLQYTIFREIIKNPIKSEIIDPKEVGEFPVFYNLYDVSNLMPQLRVKAKMTVELNAINYVVVSLPGNIHARNFRLWFVLEIENAENPKADEFAERLFEYFSDLPKFVGISVDFAFRKIMGGQQT